MRERLHPASKIGSSSHREIFYDLDLDVAEISFARGALALLLGWVVRFGRPRWTALESAVPIVGDKGFALVLLCRTVGIDVVDVREVSCESVERNTSFRQQQGVNSHQRNRKTGTENILFLTQGNHFIDIEQSVPPVLQIRGIWNQLHALQLSSEVFRRHGVGAESDEVRLLEGLVWGPQRSHAIVLSLVRVACQWYPTLGQ